MHAGLACTFGSKAVPSRRANPAQVLFCLRWTAGKLYEKIVACRINAHLGSHLMEERRCVLVLVLPGICPLSGVDISVTLQLQHHSASSQMVLHLLSRENCRAGLLSFSHAVRSLSRNYTKAWFSREACHAHASIILCYRGGTEHDNFIYKVLRTLFSFEKDSS
eukprot:5439922-Amphidinium_carterae.1